MDWLIDPKLAMVILVGLPIGIMFRTARMIGERHAREDITRDILVSLLISGANFVLAASLATWLDLGYMEALLGAVVIAATGVKAILGFTRWAWKRLIARDFEEFRGTLRQNEQRELSRLRLVEDDKSATKKKPPNEDR